MALGRARDTLTRPSARWVKGERGCDRDSCEPCRAGGRQGGDGRARDAARGRGSLQHALWAAVHGLTSLTITGGSWFTPEPVQQSTAVTPRMVIESLRRRLFFSH